MRLAFVFLLLLTVAGCAEETGRLTADQEQRLAEQGIARRANNLTFRRTLGGGARWQDRRGSIVVTRRAVLIHRNGEIMLLLDTRSRRAREVHRDHDRVRIHAGSGASAETWSFTPPDDPEGWTTDIRAALRANDGTASRANGGSGP